MPSRTTKPEPPAQAVARDPHWLRERLKARTRPAAKLTICDDPTVKQALARAEFTARAAQSTVDDTDTPATRAALTAAQQALEAAQAAFDDVAIVLRFQALERPVWEALKKKHQPTEDQAEEGYQFNVDTLAPELIAAASLDGITEDDAREYLDTWGNGEANALFNAAFNVQGETRMDVGKG
jgi:hypothetical protein